MSFLGDPRNMAEINKDELKAIDIYLSISKPVFFSTQVSLYKIKKTQTKKNNK